MDIDDQVATADALAMPCASIRAAKVMDVVFIFVFVPDERFSWKAMFDLWESPPLLVPS